MKKPDKRLLLATIINYTAVMLMTGFGLGWVVAEYLR